MSVASGSIAFLGVARFQGFWNATSNEASGSATSELRYLYASGSSAAGGYHSSTGVTASIGDYWQVTGSGAHLLESQTNWNLNDWVIYSGSSAGAAGKWAKLAFEDTIASIVIGSLTSSSFHMGVANDEHVIFNSGAVHSGSDNFVFDYTNNRVGIGTASPDGPLHVYKAAASGDHTPMELLRLEQQDEGVDMSAGHGPAITFYVGETGGSDHGGSVAVVREEQGDADSAAAMSFYTAGDDSAPTEKMRITSAGNVGIGTTTPKNTLSVTGTLSVSSDTYLTGTLFALGDVGIGTTSPSSGFDLEVVEDGSVLVGLTSYGDSTSADPDIRLRKSRGTEASPTVVVDGDPLGRISWFGYNADGTAFDAAASIQAEVDGEPSTSSDSSDMPGRILFSTTPDASSALSERMVIKSDGKVGIATDTPKNTLSVTGTLAVSSDTYLTGTLIALGDVGIGTTTPISALEIEDGLTTTGAVLTLGTKEPTVVANDVLGRINFYAPLETGADAISVAASIVAQAEEEFGSAVNSTSLRFQTGKSEVATTKMVIDENGYVGIGVTDPDEFLEVAGDVKISGANKLYLYDSGGEYISSDGTDLTIAAGTAINLDAGTIDLSNQTVDVTLNNAVDALNFDSNTLSIDASNNRVGIGTTTPKNTLSVTGTLAVSSDTYLTGTLIAYGNSTLGDASSDVITVTGQLTASVGALIKSTANSADCIKLHADAGAAQTITIVNDGGTSESAINLTSSLGGVAIAGHHGKDITLDGGQVQLTSVSNAAEAIKLHADLGSSQTIVVVNDAGTTDGAYGAGAIELSAPAGGIGLVWGDDKDLWCEGGRAVITANENTTDSIKLHADAGSSQTITIVNDAGTSAAAIGLTSTAGGIMLTSSAADIQISAHHGKDVKLNGGQIIATAVHDVAEAIKLHADQGASQTILLTNDAGTTDGAFGAGAIELSASAGGIGLVWGEDKDLWCEGGRAVITANENAAEAIKLHADAGASQTILLTNDAGTTDGAYGAGAIELSASAGGIGLVWGEAKDLWCEGGRTIVTANENAADCIKLHADAGTSQTITVLNDAGTNAAAIGLTATAGGITLTSAATTAVDAVTVTTSQTTKNAVKISGTALTTGDAISVDVDALTTGNALFIDHDDTATADGVAVVGMHYDFDKTGNAGDGNSQAFTGFDFDMNDDGSNHANADITMTGLNMDIVSADATGDDNTNIGLDINVTGADNNYAAIFRAGNVGIGSTSPASALTVITDGASNVAGYFLNDGNNADRYGLKIQCGVDNAQGAGSNGDSLWAILAGGSGTNLSYIVSTTSSPYAAFAAASDERIKADIAPTKINGLEVLNALEISEFRFARKDQPMSDLNRIGFIAQNCEKAYPEMVVEHEEEGYDYKMKNVAPATLIPVLVKAIQELSAEVKALKGE